MLPLDIKRPNPCYLIIDGKVVEGNMERLHEIVNEQEICLVWYIDNQKKTHCLYDKAFVFESREVAEKHIFQEQLKGEQCEPRVTFGMAQTVWAFLNDAGAASFNHMTSSGWNRVNSATVYECSVVRSGTNQVVVEAVDEGNNYCIATAHCAEVYQTQDGANKRLFKGVLSGKIK